MNNKKPIIMVNGYDTTNRNTTFKFTGNDILDVSVMKMNISTFFCNHLNSIGASMNPWIIYILNSIDDKLYLEVLNSMKSNSDIICVNILANLISSQLLLCGISHSKHKLTEFISTQVR